MLGSWYVIAASLALFAIEFVADKIPYFDLIWNALHTFVRVPLAALVAYRATATLSPWEQILATTVGGGIALAAHGGKTAARAAVTPSPEPVSNSALSVGEDVVAVSLTWFATKHPYMAAGVGAGLGGDCGGADSLGDSRVACAVSGRGAAVVAGAHECVETQGVLRLRDWSRFAFPVTSLRSDLL